MKISIPLIYEEEENGMQIPTTPIELFIDIEQSQSLVLVGANGAGKTRLGVHIEQQLFNNNAPVQRIAAQRSNAFKDNVGLTKTDFAYNMLRTGHGEDKYKQHKDVQRWGQKPATHPLNDYDAVLQVLYAEQSEATVKENQERAHSPDIERVIPKLEVLANIWNGLLPKRKLVVSHADIKVAGTHSEDSQYAASELSDGERVMLYLIGQSLLAETGSVLIVDEPELHIHKAILSLLWDEIESVRPDILFIYITHDLEFAASRGLAKILAVEEFDFNTLRWQIVEPAYNADLPEPTLLKILGSRKNTLFTEGEDGKDAQLFSLLYPNKTIIERGSCESVVSTVLAFKANASLHHKECAGIIDRDGRSDDDCTILANKGIVVLPVSELENLFLLPNIWKEVLKSRRITGDELSDKMQQTKSEIIKEANTDITEYSIRATKRSLDKKMKKIGLTRSPNIAALKQQWDDRISEIDIEGIANEKVTVLQGYIDDENIEGILKHYDNKGMIAKCASHVFSQGLQTFYDELVRTLKTADGEAIIRELKNIIPDID